MQDKLLQVSINLYKFEWNIYLINFYNFEEELQGVADKT